MKVLKIDRADWVGAPARNNLFKIYTNFGYLIRSKN